jgi:acylphosphatase
LTVHGKPVKIKIENPMKRRAQVFISGKVQGVFFRANTQREARRLGLRGFVRNLPDGRVEALFEGEEQAIRQMIDWCRRGPSGARVERVDVEWGDYRGEFRDFIILRI